MDRKRWLAHVKGGCAMCPVWGGKKRLLCAFILLQPSCPPRTTAKTSICSHPAGEQVFFGSQLERDFEKNAYGIMYLHDSFGSDQ